MKQFFPKTLQSNLKFFLKKREAFFSKKNADVAKINYNSKSTADEYDWLDFTMYIHNKWQIDDLNCSVSNNLL